LNVEPIRSQMPGAASPEFLQGGGEMGALIRAHDWTATPLGAPDTWPQSLKTAVRILLTTRHPIFLWWGPELIQFYNDAYRRSIGAERHPSALGRPGRECWTEIWHIIGPQVEQVMSGGGSTWHENQLVPTTRNGKREDVYWTYSYSPLDDESSPHGVGGVLVICTETTKAVMAETRLREAQERIEFRMVLSDALRGLSDPAEINRLAVEKLGQHLRVDQANYYTVEGDGFIVEREWRTPGTKSFIGRHKLQDFQQVVTDIERSGYVVRFDDTAAQCDISGFKAHKMAALVSIPLYHDGKWAAGLHVHQTKPRVWTDGEVALIRDVAERTWAEMERARANAVRETGEERFRLIAERAPVMLWMSDHNGKCVYLNETQRNFWGVLPEKIPEFDWTATIHPGDHSRLFSVFGAAMEKHTGFQVEARLRGADGNYHVVQTTAAPRFGTNGEFLGMIGVNADVTALRHSEAELRKEKRLLEVVNETGATIAAKLDVDRIVQAVTDAGVELSGAQFGAFFYNVTNQKGESYMLYSLSGVPREAFSKFPMPRATAVFQPTFKGEGIIRSDDILKDPRYGRSEPHKGMPPGHLPVRSYLALPVISRSGEVIGGLFFGHAEAGVFKPAHESLLAGIAGHAATAIDNARLYQAAQRELEERRRAEEALQTLNATLEERVAAAVVERSKAEEALHQARKMESVGQLTGGIAHDFNNMLGVVVGSLSMLSRRLENPDARVKQFIDAAQEGASRAAQLTQRLLAFSRQQALRPETVNVGKLVKGMSELLRGSLGRDIRLQVVLDDDLWHVHADRHQLENALLNLALNARDAMPEGGSLFLEAENREIDAQSAREAGIGGAGPYVVITVTDTGQGISPEVIAKVFDPFFTTKGVGKGTGLGLSQVYGFVKQSGGHVRVSSQVQRGTIVQLYLPRMNAVEPADIHAREASLLRAEGDELVLIVDDEPRVREMAVSALEELGYKVIAAEGAAMALRLLDENPGIKLLFTDIVMPDINGRKLAEMARERFPHLKVLYTTGYARDIALHQDAGDPAHIITKPFTLAQLAPKLRAALD